VISTFCVGCFIAFRSDISFIWGMNWKESALESTSFSLFAEIVPRICFANGRYVDRDRSWAIDISVLGKGWAFIDTVLQPLILQFSWMWRRIVCYISTFYATLSWRRVAFLYAYNSLDGVIKTSVFASTAMKMKCCKVYSTLCPRYRRAPLYLPTYMPYSKRQTSPLEQLW
jgi:hypothetical protein